MNAIDHKIESFFAECQTVFSDNLPLVRQSLEIARNSLSHRLRENGDPFIFHAIEVARIAVMELGLSATSVIALFLHEARANTETQIDFATFGKDVEHIVKSLDKISGIDIKATSLQADKFRKLLVSYSNDPRITLIKLADRLEIMRSLSFFSPSKQKQKSAETRLLYAPLAHQLGLYNLKGELENLAFKHYDNISYRLVTNKLKASTNEREKFIENFIAPIEQQLKEQNYKYEIKSRTKTAYSIWRKMQKQNIDFEDVYDVFAIRIILDSALEDEQKDCFSVYSIIDNIYKTDSERFREWITRPKATGYQSLHTTVQTDTGRFVEVQIRTKRMDEIAERGAAAHWKYKGIGQEQSIEKWLNNVRQLLETHKVIEDIEIAPDTESEIYVFTPKGDLRQLPVGATVLDFAFDIHTNIGLRCIGASINGKNASIRQTLRTGDIVDINTSNKQKPKEDWLNFVITSKAKGRIKAKLREDKTKSIQKGKELLERKLKSWGLIELDEAVSELTKYYRQKGGSELYELIGEEKISIAEIKNVVTRIIQEKTSNTTEYENTLQKHSSPKTKVTNTTSTNDFIIIYDNTDLQGVGYSFAKCCNPIKGDDIFGFVSINKGLKIHRLTCPNATRLLQQFPYRIMKVKWHENEDGNFVAKIKIKGDNETGMLNKISEILQKLNVDIRNIKISSHTNTFEGVIEISVSSTKFLDSIIHKLMQIHGVYKVQRVNN